jgi:hypothetical protein
VTAADGATITDRKVGCNTSGFTHAHVQVVPSGGANPTAEILWWSEEAGQFVSEHVAISKAGVGADTPFEFTVDCQGRILFVKLTSISAGSVEVMIAGFHTNAI